METERAQRRNPSLNDKWGPTNYSPPEQAEAATLAQAPDQCYASLGRKISSIEEKERAALVRAAEPRQLDAWQKADVFLPATEGVLSEAAADSRWALTWEMVGGRKDAKARFVATSYRDPDLQDGLVGTSGCGSSRNSHLRVISFGAIQKVAASGRRFP